MLEPAASRLRKPAEGLEMIRHVHARSQITVTPRAGRQCASSGSKSKPLDGVFAPVRSGNLIAVTGTVGMARTAHTSPSLADQTRRSL